MEMMWCVPASHSASTDSWSTGAQNIGRSAQGPSRSRSSMTVTRAGVVQDACGERAEGVSYPVLVAHSAQNHAGVIWRFALAHLVADNGKISPPFEHLSVSPHLLGMVAQRLRYRAGWVFLLTSLIIEMSLVRFGSSMPRPLAQPKPAPQPPGTVCSVNSSQPTA